MYVFKSIKDHIEYYNRYFKHGTLTFIAITLCRIVLFPLMLLVNLYHWVYYEDWND